MKRLFIIYILAILTASLPVSAQPRKNHLGAFSLTNGVNVFLWSYDRFVTNSKFARINIKTVKSNFENGFVWDSDRLATNHLGHPFNGGLYYSGARCNGMNYWQSTAYSAYGSLIWEVFAENEPPGLNDFISTPLAGAAFGEVSHRLSDRILDNSATGVKRVFKELASMVVNPVRTVDRLFKGDLWRVTPDPYVEEKSQLISAYVSTGGRYLSDSKNARNGKVYPFIRLDLEYGNPYGLDDDSPFGSFTGRAVVHPGNTNDQPLFGRVSITGRLWGREIDTDGLGSMGLWGIYQHYDFFHNRRVDPSSGNDRFNFSETVAFGPGFNFMHLGDGINVFRQSLYADLIVLGAVENKNLFIIERHYNMGSGFALKSLSYLRMSCGLKLSLDTRFFLLKTWKDKDYRQLGDDIHPLYYDTPGDKSTSWAFVLEPSLEYSFSRHWGLALTASRLCIDTKFKHFAPATARTTELSLGVKYHL